MEDSFAAPRDVVAFQLLDKMPCKAAVDWTPDLDVLGESSGGSLTEVKTDLWLSLQTGSAAVAAAECWHKMAPGDWASSA